jgi:hypothetical protein
MSKGYTYVEALAGESKSNLSPHDTKNKNELLVTIRTDEQSG